MVGDAKGCYRREYLRIRRSYISRSCRTSGEISVEEVVRITLCPESRPYLVRSETAGKDPLPKLLEQRWIILEHLLRLRRILRSGWRRETCEDSNQ